MRRRIRSQLLTKWRKEQCGSITVEAAIVMPMLLLFILTFYLLLMIVSAQMALQATASASVQQIAAHIHPVALLVEEWDIQSNPNANQVEEGWRKLAYDISGSFPPPVNQLVQEGLKGNWWPAANLAGTYIGKDIFEVYIRSNATYPVLNSNKVELVYLQLPDLVKHTDQNVVMTLEYELPLKIPLFNQSVIIREQAMQRAWLPDPRPSNFEMGEEEQAYIHIVSLSPNPVRPGRKATLKVVTTPNTTIELNVVYKSGSSVAKHLGSVTSDENGEAEWTWHVSGNTTEGEWLFKLSLPAQQYELEQAFTVMKIR